MTDTNPTSSGRNLARHYKKLLKAGESGGGSFESTEGVGEPDLSASTISDRVDATQAELYRIIDDYLDGGAGLKAIADQIAVTAQTALQLVRDEDDETLADHPELLEGLEAIVRTDGSRPSFLIQNGEVNKKTSPLGSWEPTLNASADLLRDAMACVGRIDLPGSTQGFEGTGFLIQENLILTNRHVLQAIAEPGDNGVWTFSEGAAIDFGHEFRAQKSLNPRALREVVFCGSRPILTNGPIDHTRLDLALIEIEPVPAVQLPRTMLSVDFAPEWAEPPRTIFTIGYPGDPGLVGPWTPTLLEQLFRMTFGYKRLAPGQVMRSEIHLEGWSLAHDATTLGGNSGSIVVVAGRETAAAGLHYGGRSGQPAENWGHVLGHVLDQTDGQSEKTLRQILEKRGVSLIDGALG